MSAAPVAPERSVRAPVILDDVELEHWARVYVKLDLLKRGYTFEAFLRAPPAVRESAARLANFATRPGSALGRYVPGADPREVRLSAKEEAALRDGRSVLVIGNGRKLEKLRHHRHPRNFRDFLPLKEA